MMGGSELRGAEWRVGGEQGGAVMAAAAAVTLSDRRSVTQTLI